MPSTKNSLGIAISDQKIYAVVLASDGPTTTLKAFAKKELPIDALILGRPPEKQYLEKIVTELLSALGKNNYLSSAVSFAIPESHVFVHSFLSIESSDTNKQKIVNEELANILPIDIANLHTSFFQEQNKIIATAVEKTNLNTFIAIFQKAGIQIDKINVESLSAARAIQKDSKKNILLMDIGEFRSYVIFFDDNGFSESVLLSNRAISINNAIAKRFDVSEESAISMRKTSGLDPESGKGEVCMFLQDELSPIREELLKALERFSQKSKTKLKKAVIFGNIADTPNIGEYFQTAIKVRVELADPWEGIEKVPKRVQRESDYAAALGVALGSFNIDDTSINFVGNTAQEEIAVDASLFKRTTITLKNAIKQAIFYVTYSKERILLICLIVLIIVLSLGLVL
ncbi:MAG: pilus assembly protein PilM [Patescibacteria group bacterium]